MEITHTLVKPRDERSIPTARHIVRSSMSEIGVSDDSVHDVEIAISEACTNVLRHSGPGDEYRVVFELSWLCASISVIDSGRGFDFETLHRGPADVSAERGRGVQLMHALVDRVRFESKPEAGTIVHLEKEIDVTEIAPDSLLAHAVRDGRPPRRL
jgi:serine/threonine-protein kinase RsbW